MGDYTALKISALEVRSAMPTLLALLEGGETYVGNLYPKVSLSSSIMHERVKDLLDLGLIEEWREERPPRRRFVRLTEKGLAVAKLLQQVENAL